MTALQEAAMRKALEALETCSYGDYSAKHVVDPSFDGDAVEAAIESLKAALAQQELPQKERPDFMAGYDAGMADAKRMAQQGEQPTQRQLDTAMRQWETWKAYALELQAKVVKYEGGSPMILNAAAPAPQPAHQGERAELIRRLLAIANTEANEVADALNEAADMLQSAQPAQDKSDNYLSGYCTGRTDLLKEQSAQPVAQITDAAIREIADCIVSNLDSRKGVIDLDLDDDMVEEIMQEMCDTIAHGIREVK